MKTPIRRETLRQHLTYSWWKYALMIIFGAIAVNIYFTVSTYQPPEDKKVDVYVYGYGDEQEFNRYMAEVQKEQMPDMEEMRCVLMTTDATYGPMQLSTYVGAGEGDLYILPRDQFVSMAASGAWIELEDREELVSLFTDRDISLQSGFRRNGETQESHLYGIPLSQLPGLNRYVYVENGYICALVTGRNDENTLKFLRILCEDMMDEPEPAAVTEETLTGN